MIPNEALTVIANDFGILMKRVLLGCPVTYFGTDSFGKCGSSPFFRKDQIQTVEVDVWDTVDDKPFANVTCTLRDYDGSCGFVDTDTNLTKSLNNAFTFWGIKEAKFEFVRIVGSTTTTPVNGFTLRFDNIEDIAI
jgi:hypothetical protein